MQEPGLETVKLFDINSTQDVRLVAILGDSWTSEGRFKNEIFDTVPRDYIDIRPHATSSQTGNSPLSNRIVVAEGAFIQNYSQGGYTLDAFLADTEIQQKWAREVPELTIVHVGACDLANSGKYNRANAKSQFPIDLSHFLKEWPKSARKTLKSARRELRFDRRWENHKWLVVKIPVWDQSNGIRNISTDEFKYMRKRVNSGLHDGRTRFWKECRAVIMSTDLSFPKFLPKSVHLTPKFQTKFNKQVLSAAAKVLCEFCPWTKGEFVPAEHNWLVGKFYQCRKDLLTHVNFI